MASAKQGFSRRITRKFSAVFSKVFPKVFSKAFSAACLVVLTGVFSGALTGCAKNPGGQQGVVPESQIAPAAVAEDAETWAIYWYFCGSDLESKLGAGSADLKEMFQVKLPDNVRVIIETGGAEEWMTEGVNPEVQSRYIYDKDGFTKLEEVEQTNMGEADTLKNFLNFCVDNYPADHTMMLFWNHGGGVLGGVSYDEVYWMDSLSLTDLKDVFDQVCGSHHFDIVGFDACLMSTIDTAFSIKDEADYMIASQELEPGNGWNYTGIFRAFAENPTIAAEDLGKVICDTFMEGCQEYQTQNEATLAMVALDKVESLFDAYDELGDSLLMESVEDDTVFAEVSRAAHDAESYGQNSNDEGYTNMVDLGSMIEKIDCLPEEMVEKVQKALDDCILYEVRGKFKEHGRGISIYYPLDSSLRSVMDYESKSNFMSYKNFYRYQVSGDLSENVRSYIETRTAMRAAKAAGGEGAKSANNDYLLNAFFTDLIDQLENEVASEGESDVRSRYAGKDLQMLEHMGIKDEPMQYDGVGELAMDLGDQGKYVTTVYSLVTYDDYIFGKNVQLGYDWIDSEDYQSGLFKDKVRRDWWYLNDHLVYVYPVDEQDNYTVYVTPVQWKGEIYYLRFGVARGEAQATYLGLRKPMGPHYMATKEIDFLGDGDEITTRMAFGLTDEYGNPILEDYETFSIQGQVRIEKKELAGGIATQRFMIEDCWNNHAYSVMWSNPGRRSDALGVLGAQERDRNSQRRPAATGQNAGAAGQNAGVAGQNPGVAGQNPGAAASETQPAAGQNVGPANQPQGAGAAETLAANQPNQQPQAIVPQTQAERPTIPYYTNDDDDDDDDDYYYDDDDDDDYQQPSDDVSQNGSQNDNQNGSQNDNQNGSQNDNQNGSQDDNQTGSQDDNQNGSQNDNPDGGRDDNQSGGQSSNQNGSQNDNQSGSQNDNQSGSQNDNQSGSQNDNQNNVQYEVSFDNNNQNYGEFNQWPDNNQTP